MRIIRIENWGVTVYPCELEVSLYGTVYGHPHICDGSSVTTSRIVGVDGGLVITASSSRYSLGSPNTAYERVLKKSFELAGLHFSSAALSVLEVLGKSKAPYAYTELYGRMVRILNDDIR